MDKVNQSGSAPDLSSEQLTREERMSASRRKRGYNDDFKEAFDEFTENIKTMVKNWKTEFSQETSQINESLNKLNISSQELKSELTSIKNDYLEIKNSMGSPQRTFNGIQMEFNSLKTSVDFNSAQYDDVTKKLQDQANEIKSISVINAEIIEIKKQNTKLQSDLNSNEQRDRLLNIEIVGVPENTNEDLTEFVLKLGESAEINLTNADIIQVHRVTPKFKIQGRPRNIIAKLRTRQIKDNIISQTRKRRMTTKDLGMQGKITPVYVNEHLTIYNKNLLKKAKETANTKEYQYAWVKNGRIYVRKASTTPAIPITVEEDLKKIT